MALYTLGVTPLLTWLSKKLKVKSTSASKQVAFVDGLNSIGILESLQNSGHSFKIFFEHIKDDIRWHKNCYSFFTSKSCSQDNLLSNMRNISYVPS